MTHFATGRTAAASFGTSRGESSATPMNRKRQPTASESSRTTVDIPCPKMP